MHEADIYKIFTVNQFCQDIPFVLEKGIIQYRVQNSK